MTLFNKGGRVPLQPHLKLRMSPMATVGYLSMGTSAVVELLGRKVIRVHGNHGELGKSRAALVSLVSGFSLLYFLSV